VTAPATNDFSISANPTSLSIAQGASGNSTISTAVTSGSAGTVNLTSSVSPAGPTASLNPTSVTAGSSSTLTVTVGSSVAAGTYTVTVTGTEGSATHSTSVTVTVTTSGGGGGITNGGFETGTFSGWTTSGAATSISSTAHSGSFSGQAGATTPTNGDSNIAQTFTAPAGTTGLSFYYKVVCPDSVTYNWATATLKDNTTGTTATILAKTCTNSGAWVQVTAGITAGHSYTLTLTSHDDNYNNPPDPTYTLFDDATLTSTPPPPSGITNGGFETGNFSGWTTSGTTSISTSSHSGTYAGQAGSTSPTNGDSSISQTFTAPTGTTTLSFYYKVVCPDTLTYDWATATLKDNTTGTTTTILAKTFTNTGAWVKVTASITAGHSYTLTLTSHDDNYFADPTYTLFDDVNVQ
jgi:Fe-S cluster assembly iron-binding protein IscA